MHSLPPPPFPTVTLGGTTQTNFIYGYGIVLDSDCFDLGGYKVFFPIFPIHTYIHTQFDLMRNEGEMPSPWIKKIP